MGGEVIIPFLLSFIIICSFEMPFQYNCFVSRIPIFLFGIYEYNGMSSGYSNELNLSKWIYITGILGVIIFIYANIEKPELLFMSTSLLAPALIVLLVRFVQHIPQRTVNLICYIGKYSLEFYIANLCIHSIIGFTTYLPIKITIYILGNLLLAILLVPLNKFCKDIFS